MSVPYVTEPRNKVPVLGCGQDGPKGRVSPARAPQGRQSEAGGG